MTNEEDGFKEKANGKFKRWGIFAGVILLAFLLGLVPMWLQARSYAAERDAALTQLRESQISNLLSSAIVNARRGEYETARQETSEFFTRLQAEEDRGDEGFLNADQRTKLKLLFAGRDAAITMLAQRDPASLDKLTDFHVAYGQSVGAKQPSIGAFPANTAK